MKPILEVRNISKKFRISHQKQPYLSLRDSMVSLFSRNNMQSEDFWALNDISFDLFAGDSLGIIGRNGAGKSTLLKILSRITPPTSGKIISRGRIASLLEVGTGFHPELSGRENIFLNGSILGMKRKEIEKKFDEIVNFSGTEQFLDTPLKHYSSGMQLRLAFSVAAFLEPEILIIDEVLAVGDAEFQKKCMGKMEDVSKNEGRTILFVSHNMLAVKSLCQMGVCLDKGVVKSNGKIENVIDFYLSKSNQTVKSFINIERESNGFTVHSLNISNNGVEGNFDIENDLVFDINVTGNRDFETININIFFKTAEGVTIFAVCSPAEKFNKGNYEFRCTIPAYTLNDIIYNIDLMVVENGPKILHLLKEIISIEGHEGKREGAWLEKFPGLIRPQYFKWKKAIAHE